MIFPVWVTHIYIYNYTCIIMYIYCLLITKKKVMTSVIVIMTVLMIVIICD